MSALSILTNNIYYYLTVFFDNSPAATYVSNLPWMHIYAASSLVMFGFKTYLNFRQYFHCKKLKEKPKQIADIISDEDYENSRIYEIDKMKFKIVSSSFSMVLEMVSLYTFMEPKIWSVVASWMPNTSEITKSIVFTTISSFISQFISLPFDLYYDFVLEERHGFNNKTLGLFFKDMALSTLVSSIFTPPLISLFLVVTKYSGKYFIPIMFTSCGILLTLVQIILPNVIMPLFNKFDSLKDEDLKKKVFDFSKEKKFPAGKIYQIDASKRSKHANAYFVGIFGIKQIVLFDSILNFSHEEILSVLAHEIGHWNHSHTFKMTLDTIPPTISLISLYSLVMNNSILPKAFGYNGSEFQLINFLLFSKLMSPLLLLWNFTRLKNLRKYEYEADKFAHDSIYGEYLIPALKRLHQEGKSFCYSDPLYVRLSYSHPTLLERIQKMESYKIKDSKKNE